MSAINNLVALAEAQGLSGTLTEWSEANVWWFEAPMPAVVRAAGAADQTLDAISTDGDPHNRADDGFIDRQASLAISFPRQT